MTTLSFPSESFPAFPRLSVEAPENWVGLAAVGMPLALARELDGQTFRPNVLCSVNRSGLDQTFDKHVAGLNARVKKLPRFKEVARVQTDLEDRTELLLEGRFAGGKGELLKQFVRIVVIKRGYVDDVFEITGTVSLLAGDNGEDEVRDVVRSVIVEVD